MKRYLVLIIMISILGVGTMANDKVIPEIDINIPQNLETATFGLGCFWGAEASFGALKGVYRTRVGYAGGTVEDPTYYNIGDHTEVVQIDFNPSEISYEKLLDTFWKGHTPYLSSYSQQYKSVILYHNEDQKNIAEEYIKEKESIDKMKATTEIYELEKFYMAENYHQKYLLKQNVTLTSELEKYYPEQSGFVNSTAVARVNGYLFGESNEELYSEERNLLGLSEYALKFLDRRNNY